MLNLLPFVKPNYHIGDDMHLDSLKIQNFRILEDIEVKRLGHVNLIVGKNNSGKSTVLEALALLASGFKPKILENILNNRSFNRHLSEYDRQQINMSSLKNLLSVSKNFEVSDRSFRIGNDEYYLTVNFVYFIVEESIQHDDLEFLTTMNRKILNKEQAESYEFINNKKTHNGLLIKNSFGKSKFISLEQEFIDFDLEYTDAPLTSFGFIDTGSIDLKEISTMWDKIALTEDENLVLKALQIIEPNIQNLAFLTETSEYEDIDRFERTSPRTPYIKLANREGRHALHSMGDGIFRLLQIILNVLKAKDGFLLIDEFENGLHYSVQPDVWRLVFKLAKEFNIQVFATTHSWDCIESFAEVAKESELDGVLFRLGRSVRKSDNGKVIATEFDEDELYNMTKMQMEVR